MFKFLGVLLIAFALSMAGCANLGAGTPSTGSGAGMSAAEIAKQADGVATALSSLPKAPDAATAKQIEGYAAWGAFLARSAAVIVGAVGS